MTDPPTVASVEAASDDSRRRNLRRHFWFAKLQGHRWEAAIETV